MRIALTHGSLEYLNKLLLGLNTVFGVERMVVCEGLEPIFSSLRGLRLNQFVLHTIWYTCGGSNPILHLERVATQPVCLQAHIRDVYSKPLKKYTRYLLIL